MLYQREINDPVFNTIYYSLYIKSSKKIMFRTIIL